MNFSVKIKLFLLVLTIVSSATLVAYVIYRGNVFLSVNLILGFYLLILTTVIATYFIYQYFKRLVNSAAQLIAKNNIDDPSVASEEIFDELLKESSQVEDELVYYTQQTEQFSSVSVSYTHLTLPTKSSV